MEATRPMKDPEPSQDINVPLPLGLGQLPNQPFPPDFGHRSGNTSPSVTPWVPPMDNLSLLQLFDDTPQSSESSTPPFRPATKHEKPETGHWSSISDRHQHTRYLVTDSPPSEERSSVRRKKIHPLVLEPGFHLDNILMKLLLSFTIILIKIAQLWKSKHSSTHQLKQDDLLEFLYPGLFLTVRMGIDLQFKSRETYEDLHLFRRSLCKLNHVQRMKMMI
jgi:hypothetical protein